MAQKKITQLAELLYAGVANDDVFAIDDISDGASKKIKISELVKFILGNRAIGTNAPDAFVTTNANQTLSDKRLDAPKLNSETAITATGAEVNILSGISATTAELNKMHGVFVDPAEINALLSISGNVQAQIDALSTVIPPATERVRRYSLEFGAAGANQTITQSDILTAVGGLSGMVIDHRSLVVSIWSVTGNQHEALDVQNVTVISKTVGLTEQLDYIKIGDLTPAQDYLITVYFTAKFIIGV